MMTMEMMRRRTVPWISEHGTNFRAVGVNEHHWLSCWPVISAIGVIYVELGANVKYR
jgi:hypothetical protein